MPKAYLSDQKWFAGGCPLLRENLAETDNPFKIAISNQYSLDSEEVQLTRIGSPLYRLSNEPKMNSVYVALKVPISEGLKNAKCPKFEQ